MTTFDRQTISVEGMIDPWQPDVLTGVKIIKSDGKEEAVITWHLKWRADESEAGPDAKKKQGGYLERPELSQSDGEDEASNNSPHRPGENG